MNKELAANTTLAHYRIVSKIGAGGMGEVYLAQDTKLDRKVALKILPADLATNKDRMRRFEREAKSAAALNHPNIAHIYEIGEGDGTNFIAMEFIDGVTLREKIHRDRAPLAKLLKYLIQVAEGLSKAHAAGIVHRDLKPDNIMITRDEYAKVLDFGLAKLVEPPGTFESGRVGSSEIATAIMQQQSIPGMVMGTIGYMSPEQASGRVHEIDHRSDIFSFGCILFEAVTGQRPFEGKDALDSLHKIVHAPTPQLKDVNPLAPDDLQRVVRRCLAKEPEKRYQSMKELAIELDDLQQELKGLTGAEYSRRPASSTTVTTSGTTRADEGFWVAVLPFKSSGRAKALKALAEGLSEDIVTGLSRFSYLHVIARGSTLRYANQTTDLRTGGKELGARYVMEGTLRQAGTKLRLAVQLVDATTGSHLWAENYEREFSPENIFELQDDLVPRVVSTVADWYGVLPHSMSESVRLKPPDQLSPYEALLRSFGYFENIAPEEHAIVRSSLERAVAQEPGNADGWAMLSMLFGEEHRFGFNVEPDSLGRSLEAARKAVAIAHANHFAWSALAQALFFRKELDAFRDAAERAIALNPMDGSTVEYLGHLIAFSGNWERGCELAERARQLNPNHPSWYWAVPFLDAYRKGDYLSARTFLTKGNPQKNYLMHALLAAVNGQLGESEAAARHLREVLTMMPDFPSIGRAEFSKWYLPELVDHLMDGLRKAGLETAGDETPSGFSSTPAVSSMSRADEGFWVAVLPFKYSGGNAELASLADGLSEDVVTGLSRFSYLRVISRTSTPRNANETDDIRTLGKTLGARYVMEGSLRIVGSSLRTSVQLIDASTGAHLWAETYDRQFRAEEVFALQDDLVPRIVSTVADVNGVLPRSMSEVICNRNQDELSPYEAVLRSFRYFDRVTAKELAAARSCLELAVEKAPTNADAWAMLALLCCQDYGQGFNLQSDSLNRGTIAAQRAVEAGPSNHLAHFSLAQARFFQKELQSFRNAAERAVALNPMDANSLAFMGELLTYVGDWERGLALASRAKQINPNHPGWFWYADFFHAYRQSDYRGALALVLKANLPGHWGMHAGIAAAAGQLGDHEAAGKAVRDLLKVRPDFCITVRHELKKWFDPELRENLVDGLRKAGLEIAGEESGEDHVSSESRADEGFWIAVLPFKVVGPGTGLETLALGMTEEIVTGFSRFSYLRVMAPGSILKHSQSGDPRQIGVELGARYVMEGSIRQAGSTVRLAVQLVDASNGAHLWAETFDRHFQSDQIFAMQDELIPRIVSTCADHFGVLARSISDAVREKESSQLSPYEALMRGFGYHYRLNSQEHAEARDILEQAVKEAPNNADCWAMLSWVYSHEYGHGFNTLPGSLDRALVAARRAVDLAPTNHLAYQTLAVALFFRKERANCLSAAERAMALNPLDASNEAIFLITFVDDWERGCALIRRAMDLNPYVPGWYRLILALNEYRKGNYREAVAETVNASAPGIWTDIVLTAAYAQLGEQTAASNALGNLHAENSADSARELLTKWFDAEVVEHLVEGLCKAGLEIAYDKSSTSRFSPQTSPANSLGSLFKSIAVLPFQNLSVDPEQEFFADGITEEILNALAQIKDLRVAGRSSSFSFKGRNEDLRSVGAKLNVTNILEGTLRRSGDRLRITAQLIDAGSGYQLWSERYDRVLEDIFDIQDEIALAVVDALKLKLFGDAKEAVVRRYTDDAEVHELFLKGRYYSYKYTAAGWNRAVEFFEKVIEKQPCHAPAHAGKAAALGCLWFFGLSPADEAVPQFRSAATKAIELDGNLAGAHLSLGMVNFFHDWEWEKAEQEFKQAILLNPKDAEALSYYAMFLGFVDRFDEAMALARRALEVDPLSLLINMNVGWTYFSAGLANEAFDQARKMTEIEPGFFGAYWLKGATRLGSGDYEEAIEQLTKAVSLGGYPIVLADLGAAYALAGKKETAETILGQLLDMRRQSYVPAICLARVYSRLGELEKTIQWLETAYEERNGELVFLESEITSAAKGDSLNSLGKDPRVKDLLERMKLPSRDQGE